MQVTISPETLSNNLKVVAGDATLDGSNPTVIQTGLTEIHSVTATLRGSTAPGVGTSTLTHTVSGGQVNVYAWKPTSNSDPTLVASTGTEVFTYVVVGR